MKTSDKVITFSAIFISCLALVVSIIQTRILQKQSQAAVWPRIQMITSFGGDFYELDIVNQGVGPAIISNIEYSYQDTSFYRILDVITYIAKEDQKSEAINLNLGYSEIMQDRVTKPFESINIYEALDSTSVRMAFKYFENIDIKIDYCSIYERCWRFRNDEILEL